MTSSALQSRKWQLIDMNQWCRSALCGHLLLALTDNWTHGAASRHTIAQISHTRPSPRSRSHLGQLSLAIPIWVGEMSTNLHWKGNRRSAVKKLHTHWRRTGRASQTIVVYPPTGSTAYEREISTPPTLLRSMTLLYLYLTIKICVEPPPT